MALNHESIYNYTVEASNGASKILAGIDSLNVRGIKDLKSHIQAVVGGLAQRARMEVELMRPSVALHTVLTAKNLLQTYRFVDNSQVLIDTRAPSGRQWGSSLQHVVENLHADALALDIKAHMLLRNAEKIYVDAIHRWPAHPSSYVKYASMLQKIGRLDDALDVLTYIKYDMLFSAQDVEFVQFHRALILLENYPARMAEAAAHFAQIRDRELRFESTFNAAIAYREADPPQFWDNAEFHYRLAVQIRPQDASTHANLGAMLHLRGKYLDAHLAYQEASKLDPNNPKLVYNMRSVERRMRLQNQTRV